MNTRQASFFFHRDIIFGPYRPALVAT